MVGMTRDTSCPAASERPLRRDAELNRQRIIAAARDVFRDRGFEGTLDDIAHHAGLGVGTVYRRFPSKEHLVEAMFAERLDEIRELAEKALAEPDAWVGLVQFVMKTAELHTADRGLREAMLSTSFGHQKVAEARERMVPACIRLVEHAQETGQLRADIRPTDLPALHVMIGSIADYAHDVDPQLWQRYVVLLLDGLRAQPGAVSELPRAALDEDKLDCAMSTWRRRRPEPMPPNR
jgi:AcrR family transcriptional regulator